MLPGIALKRIVIKERTNQTERKVISLNIVKTSQNSYVLPVLGSLLENFRQGNISNRCNKTKCHQNHLKDETCIENNT